MGEYVSPVIRRSLSNVTGNLKKTVRLGDYFLNTFILEFLFANGYKKNTSQYLYNKIVKKEKFLDTFLHMGCFS